MKEIGYRDERMSDGIVCRRFEDGRTEWRTRQPDERVTWRDAAGDEGTDELLGDRIIKRTHAAGRVEYARDQGYGRTAWPDDVLTINRTALSGRIGAGLAVIGLGTAAAIIPPPLTLSAAEEEELRRRKQANDSGGDGGGSGSGDSGDTGKDEWGEDLEASDGGEDDFG